MLIIRQKMIYRADLRANPHLLYVFGDNLQRLGMGGQAGEMRGEPNAFGFATKRDPGMTKDSFFYDTDRDTDIAYAELANLHTAIHGYQGLVVPLDGIGSGLARLNETAPGLFKFINEQILKVGE